MTFQLKSLFTRTAVPVTAVLVAFMIILLVFINLYLKEMTVRLNTAYLVLKAKSLYQFAERGAIEMVGERSLGYATDTALKKDFVVKEIETFLLSEGISGLVIENDSLLYSNIDGVSAPILKEDSGTVKIKTANGIYYGYYLHFPIWNWYVVSLMHEVDYWKTKTESNRVIIAALTGFFLLIGIILLFMRHYIKKPFEIIISELQKDGRVNYKSGIRDIDVLTEAANSAILALEHLNTRLEDSIKNEINKSRQKDYIIIQQSRLAAMGEMIGAIAHQWRQPLNALGLVIQDIADAYAFGELNKEYIANSVEKGMNLIHFMSKTIDDFRNFFRPDKEKVPFDIKIAAADVFSMLSAQLRANNISYRLICHIHNETFEDFTNVILCDPFNITGYPNEMKQVFLNIINNAKDAILQRRQKGLMQADEKGLIAFDFDRAGDNVIIRITDNGGGVPEEIIDRIFDPYFTTKEQGKGTGIGLYMSKMIIEKNMGGRIYVENKDGGAVFIIELPLNG